MKIRGTSATRLEQNYAEALASLGDPKNICAALEGISQTLLENLKSRIEWKINDTAARTPHQPVSLTAEMAELGRIADISATLANPHLDGHRTGDPDAGAKEIVRILKLAREEHENVKAETPVKKGGKDTVSVEESGEEGEGDKISQNPTPEAKARIERGPEISRLCLSRGKVRRGSG